MSLMVYVSNFRIKDLKFNLNEIQGKIGEATDVRLVRNRNRHLVCSGTNH